MPEAASPRRRLGVGAAIILILGALAVTVVIGVVRAGGGAASTPAVSATRPAAAPTSGTQKRVYVDVAGAVKRPGLFVLPGDARVLDAISAAGGFASKAARGSVNLARPLTDGEQLVVPAEGATPSPTGDAANTSSVGDSSGAPAAGGKVDLNTATKEQLEELPRIGPALAQRILQWRKDNGRFTSVDDLQAVSGIGDKMLAALRDLVRV
ncbi:competence protein ComEA [Microbacterium mangrovi]|uniref:Competence protein ComEA n=1 Tax=Microbacterium mangrovi TaxID=1348253 RepID=A0A0B2A632_9MICO|nr:ComEA family DNA-binding protein [Microbacterium mangrovi]KHK98969.1 competence protein ComEA [Microbacterium mangrovi]